MGDVGGERRAGQGILGAYEGLDFVALMRDMDPADLRALYESVYDPDIEIAWVDTNPNPGPFRGIDEAMRAFEEWFESFDEFFMTTTEYLDAGDEVVVSAVTPGRGKDSGAQVEMPVYLVIAVRNGKIARYREYLTKAEALEAAGLRE
jgi:ketosteroid isomerase-like protein